MTVMRAIRGDLTKSMIEALVTDFSWNHIKYHTQWTNKQMLKPERSWKLLIIIIAKWEKYWDYLISQRVAYITHKISRCHITIWFYYVVLTSVTLSQCSGSFTLLNFATFSINCLASSLRSFRSNHRGDSGSTLTYKGKILMKWLRMYVV